VPLSFNLFSECFG